MFKISSEIIEKCRVCNFFGDCNWVKVANGDTADFVHLLGFYGYKSTFNDILSYKMQRICRLIVLNEQTWFLLKNIDIWPIYESKIL